MSASTSYCAFLRGINVGKINLKMDAVKKVFSDLGLQNVQSVLATGNILFESTSDRHDLKEIIEKALSLTFGYEAFIFLRTADEVRLILENCPFETSSEEHVYIFIGDESLAEILKSRFYDVEKMLGEEAAIVDAVFYWKIQKGNTLDSKFGKVIGQKSLKSQLTSRNKNTFDKIVQKLYL